MEMIKPQMVVHSRVGKLDSRRDLHKTNPATTWGISRSDQ